MSMREFILRSVGEVAYVEVDAADTLSDVRRSILEELDDDQLPAADGNFAFRVDGVRLSSKQEARKVAFELLERGAGVELVARPGRKRGVDGGREDGGGGKRAKIGDRGEAKADDVARLPAETSNRTRGDERHIRGLARVPNENEVGKGGTIASQNTPLVGSIRSADENEVGKGSFEGRGRSVTETKNDCRSEDVETARGSDAATEKTSWGGDGDVAMRRAANVRTEDLGRIDGATGNPVKSAEFSDSETVDLGMAEAIFLEDQNGPGADLKQFSDDAAGLGVAEKMLEDQNGPGANLDDSAIDPTFNSGEVEDIDDADVSSINKNDSDGKSLEASGSNQENATPHKTFDKAKEISHQVLGQLAGILEDNPDFCPRKRKSEWLQNIKDLSAMEFPQIVFGVLGNTGVGKSSLLNGLLDEAAVLPTSGSRGCTAAVVELVFHSDLILKAKEGQNLPVYIGEVEFISIEDWNKELKVLVEECSLEEKRILATDDQLNEDARAAWQRIEKVYGQGVLDEHRKHRAKTVWQVLAKSTKNEHLHRATKQRGRHKNITLEEWKRELKALVHKCSAQERLIEYNLDAKEALQKIDQVYGKEVLKQHELQPPDMVFQELADDARVKKLLTATEPERHHNSILVQVGTVVAGSNDARELLKNYDQMDPATQKERAKWAQEFRHNINSYVYRNGDEAQPQTWPLIRKVCLKGPWPVLSTGATLVDLPGVKDSNAARVKVAENYIQNCNQIAIVAPIKRAVDDGIARELLGEQFKRRLLMDGRLSTDGQHGDVFFICTQTDDIEPAETLRDHKGVAQNTPGRWDKMLELYNNLSGLKIQISGLKQQEVGLCSRLRHVKQRYTKCFSALKKHEQSLNNASSASKNKKSEGKTLEEMRTEIDTVKTAAIRAKRMLEEWQIQNSPILERLQTQCRTLEMELKALCAIVRNEYSQTRLQEDFQSGIRDLYDDDDCRDELPEYNMDVFCISANDYLKVMKIKSLDPSTFSKASETQMPLLRSFVHQVTARFSKQSVETFVESTHDILDQIKLLAANVENVPKALLDTEEKIFLCLDTTMEGLGACVDPIAQEFRDAIQKRIQQSLAPALQTGAEMGYSASSTIVKSWGSQSRRSMHERGPDKNGLHFSTYFAVALRAGAFTSRAVGAIDLNQELVDPMEQEYSNEWQAVLDTAARRLLLDAKRKILSLCTSTTRSISLSLRDKGIVGAQQISMMNIASRSADTAIESLFGEMWSTVVKTQRELSRELLPFIKEKMKSTYQSVVDIPRGRGCFDLMKQTMTSNSTQALEGVFDEAKKKLTQDIDSLVNKQLKLMFDSTSDIIKKSFFRVFSIGWDDDQSDESRERSRACRFSKLPELNKLLLIQGRACELLGIMREGVELDPADVEMMEQSLQQKLGQANGGSENLDHDSDNNLDRDSDRDLDGDSHIDSYGDFGKEPNEESGSSEKEEKPEELWELRVVLPVAHIRYALNQCETPDCDLVACCAWSSNLDPESLWYCCLDCQTKSCGGWPLTREGLPLKVLKDDHRKVMLDKCTTLLEPEMPDLPSGTSEEISTKGDYGDSKEAESDDGVENSLGEEAAATVKESSANSGSSDIMENEPAALGEEPLRSNYTGGVQTENYCNKLDEESGSSEKEEKAKKLWHLRVVLPVEHIRDASNRCETPGCDLVACCVWSSNLDPESLWCCCLDCQSNDFGGWPETLPLKVLKDDHRKVMLDKCTTLLELDMPDLPSGSSEEISTSADNGKRKETDSSSNDTKDNKEGWELKL